MFRKFLVMALVAVVAALVAPSVGQAAFTMTIAATGGNSYLIQDNYRTVAGTSNLPNQFFLDPTAAPNFDDAIGTSQFSVAQAVGAGKGEINVNLPANAPFFPDLLTQVNTKSNSPGVLSGATLFSTALSLTYSGAVPLTLTITIADDTYTTPGAGTMYLSQTVSGTALPAGGSATSQSSVTDSGGTASTIIQVIPAAGSPLTAPLVLFTRTNSVFTLGTVIVVNFNGAGTATFTVNSALVPTPAPAGLLLAALGIPAFGLLRRIGRKSGVAQVAVAA